LKRGNYHLQNNANCSCLENDFEVII